MTVSADTPRRCIWSANDEKPRGTVLTRCTVSHVKSLPGERYCTCKLRMANLYGNFLTEQIVLFTTGCTQLHGVSRICEQDSCHSSRLQLLLPAEHCLRNDPDAEQGLSTERSAIHTNLGGTPTALSDQQLGESRSH